MGLSVTALIPQIDETSRTLLGLLLLCSTIFIFLQKWRKNGHFERLASKFPGPVPLPIIGNALEFPNSDPSVILFRLVALVEKYGSPFRLWLGNKLVIVIVKPEDLQIVLNSSKTSGKNEIYKFLWPLVGTGLLTAPLKKWKETRKAIRPAFGSKPLEHFLPIMNERTSILLQKLQQQCGSGDEINLFPYLNSMSMDTICEIALGVKMNTQLNQNSEFASTLQKASDLLAIRMYKPWLYPNFVFNRSTYSKKLDENSNFLRGFTQKVIQRIKAENAETKQSKLLSNSNESETDKKFKMLVDILFEQNDQGYEFSESDMIDEALTFMIAGSEPNTVATCFCLLLLAMHPEIQDKVFEEQYRIFGKEERPVTPEDLVKMEYTDQTLRETLRLYPPVPVIQRAVTEDTKITQDFVLPAGATVIIAPILTQKDPNIWPEPHKFNPDNFSESNLEKKHKYSFVAFSGGARNCLGYRYAMMGMKTAISMFVRHFEVKTTTKQDDIKLTVDVLMRCGGWNVSVEPRIYPKS